MALIAPPPIGTSLIDPAINNAADSNWARWFQSLRTRANATPVLTYIETQITFTALASAASVTLKAAGGDESYYCREIFLSGEGTNFDAGGDRALAIQDTSGSVIWTVIPNATLESLTAGRWGSTAVPFPATVADWFDASTAGNNIVAKYSGGTTDHTSGVVNVIILLERVET